MTLRPPDDKTGRHVLTIRAVITDPNDPKFDLEAYLTQVQKDSP